MGNNLLNFLGILVSVVIFLFGYRQTVGAYKERVRTANTDLEKLLLKRIILESYQPTTEDLSHLINGKALDHRVKAKDLLSGIQLLEIIFARIIESDFVITSQRNEIIEWLSSALIKAEEIPVEDISMAELPSPRERLYSINIIPGIMALFASIIGVLITLLPGLSKTTKFLTPSMLLVFAISFIVITIISLFSRFKESQQEISSGTALQSTIDFEQEVAGVLRKLGLEITSEFGELDRGFDFMIMMGGKKILLEVKSWSSGAPISIIRHLVVKLREASKAYGANEAIIITKTPVELHPDLLKDTGIRIMSLREFRNYVVHGKA
jgi:hypothetical protein